MQRTLTSELPSRIGERVLLAGWLHHRRELSRLSFLVLRDRAGLAQVVVTEPDALEQLAGLQPESVLEVSGDVVASAQAPGGVELHEPEIRVLVAAPEAPPIELRRRELKEQLPTILDHAPVALRHPRERAKFELAAGAIAGFRAALGRLGFTEIQTPKIVASATEGGSNVFALDYFGRPAYLAQSPQFYKQMMVGVFERVFEMGPVFRAEPHDTASPPQRVRVARRRAGVHRGPLHRDGSRARRGATGWSRACARARRRSSGLGSSCRRSRPRSRTSTSRRRSG